MAVLQSIYARELIKRHNLKSNENINQHTMLFVVKAQGKSLSLHIKAIKPSDWEGQTRKFSFIMIDSYRFQENLFNLLCIFPMKTGQLKYALYSHNICSCSQSPYIAAFPIYRILLFTWDPVGIRTDQTMSNTICFNVNMKLFVIPLNSIKL